MSFFEDQEDAWFENDCIGEISDYDPHDPDSWPTNHSPSTAPWVAAQRKSKKSNKRNRMRANARRKAAIQCMYPLVHRPHNGGNITTEPGGRVLGETWAEAFKAVEREKLNAAKP